MATVDVRRRAGRTDGGTTKQPAGGRPYGYQSPSQWAAFGSWMYNKGLLKTNPDTTGFPPFTNEFLPGEGI